MKNNETQTLNAYLSNLKTPLTNQQKISFKIPVDINSASYEDLVLIPKIGPILGYKIINYKNKNGSIKNLDELNKIKGIGDKKLSIFKKHLFVQTRTQ